MNSYNLQKGQKIDLIKDIRESGKFIVVLDWDVIETEDKEAFEIDSAAFMLDINNKVTADNDFIFYNNPTDNKDSVVHRNSPFSKSGKEHIIIDLSKIPSDFNKIAFTITIHNAEKKLQSFNQIKTVSLKVLDGNTGQELITYTINESFSVETAIVIAEIYRYKTGWKFNAVGSGYKGGLAALCKSFGVDVEEEIQTTTHKVNLSKINLLKNKVSIVLEKKKVPQIKAKVALVLDISGSMSRLYKNGTVQNVLDRIAAMAASFDDDGLLDMWIFDDKFTRLPAVSEKNYENYIDREILDPKNGKTRGRIFGANDEPPVMRDVINFYMEEQSSSEPVYVVFISDGGVHKNGEIKEIITKASSLPIFWQFVGIGRSNYGILVKLDALEGRIIDNANFFSLDDIESISDEDLYSRLLNEFPEWLAEAGKKHII